MNLAPLLGLVTGLLAQLMPFAIPLVTIFLFIAGLYWASGNQNHGKEKAIAAFIGGAIMLGAQTMASGLHA